MSATSIGSVTNSNFQNPSVLFQVFFLVVLFTLLTVITYYFPFIYDIFHFDK